MTDFIIYCDKLQFLGALRDAVDSARERGEDAGVLIKCGDDKYVVCETTTGKGTYSVKFENPRPNPSDAYVIWTVSFDEAHVDEVDVVGNTWRKPYEEQCENVALWFLYQGVRVGIPEYDLDYRPDELWQDKEEDTA